jgi:hypothetical protein
LENAILAEKKMQQLRIISAGSLLSIAEMMNEYDIAHDDVLALIWPSTPTIDPVVDLMSRLVAGSREESKRSSAPAAKGPSELKVPTAKTPSPESGELVV